MKVRTRNQERTIHEMAMMWNWVCATFGTPGSFEFDDVIRWTYGKDPDWTDNDRCNGTYDIEWFDFANKDDAEWFILRWS